MSRLATPALSPIPVIINRSCVSLINCWNSQSLGNRRNSWQFVGVSTGPPLFAYHGSGSRFHGAPSTYYLLNSTASWAQFSLSSLPYWEARPSVGGRSINYCESFTFVCRISVGHDLHLFLCPSGGSAGGGSSSVAGRKMESFSSCGLEAQPGVHSFLINMLISSWN